MEDADHLSAPGLLAGARTVLPVQHPGRDAELAAPSANGGPHAYRDWARTSSYPPLRMLQCECQVAQSVEPLRQQASDGLSVRRVHPGKCVGRRSIDVLVDLSQDFLQTSRFKGDARHNRT